MANKASLKQNLEELLGGGDSGNLDVLLDLLEKLWDERRKHVNDRWSRTLPFSEYIVDRWKKAELLGFGQGTSIYDSAMVFGDVSVGINTWIGPHVILDGSGGLIIGDNCSISAGVQIYSHDSVKWAVSGGMEPYEHATTNIGNNCYVGPNTVINKGVNIGSNCVIGANSLVLRDVPTGSKAWGNPVKIQNQTDQIGKNK